MKPGMVMVDPPEPDVPYSELLLVVNEQSRVIHRAGFPWPNIMYWHTRCGQHASRTATPGDQAFRSMCHRCLQPKTIPTWVAEFDPVERLNRLWRFNRQMFGTILAGKDSPARHEWHHRWVA